jgi:type IV secretory pathway VirB2 component (pilin)
MSMTEVIAEGGPAPATAVAGAPPRDLQRTFQLVLATVWLLDAVLQLQPFMFTRGSNGFSGMLNSLAAGNPGWITHSITWNASNVYHQPILTNSLFALVQFLIAFGITWKPTLKAALALSIVWSLGVWWFGEGLGNILHGGATPFGGGPGGVLFYALLAVLLWPSGGSDRPFVAARTVGVGPAKAIWAVVWGLLAVLAVVGSGRSPQALHDLVAGLNSGQPGWLAHLDKSTESLLLQHGTTVAILLAVVCVVVAVGVYLSPGVAQFTLVLGIVVFVVIWVATQNFGGILAGGATDPNSGPLIVLLALIYWPLGTARQGATSGTSDSTTNVKEALVA